MLGRRSIPYKGTGELLLPGLQGLSYKFYFFQSFSRGGEGLNSYIMLQWICIWLSVESIISPIETPRNPNEIPNNFDKVQPEC